jgi:alpha-tubulin suppressor-like RCC1 family protein
LFDTCPDDTTEWTQIECGTENTAALTKKGEVYTWGKNRYGQLGHGDKISRHIPTKVESLVGLVIIKISCGRGNMVALTDKGEIFTWYVHWNSTRTTIISSSLVVQLFFTIRFDL